MWHTRASEASSSDSRCPTPALLAFEASIMVMSCEGAVRAEAATDGLMGLWAYGLRAEG